MTPIIIARTVQVYCEGQEIFLCIFKGEHRSITTSLFLDEALELSEALHELVVENHTEGE
jgi:hypothetical protein